MNVDEARVVAIVRAFETPVEAPWSDADAEAVTREAARDVGESASPERFLARRATIAAGRLAERDPVAAGVLRSGAASLGASLAVVALVVAFGLGFASDSVAANGRINLLAPPLLALIVWNLGVYAVMLASWLNRRRRSTTIHPLRALLTDALQRWLTGPRRAGGPWLRFTRAWSSATRLLQTQRIAALLHAGAVAFACGALGSLYLRGLVFEFRAGWDSTFLTPAGVHAWLSWVLGPASALTGIALPTPAALADLRFSGGTGTNAAPWIHMYAVTVAALVVWPRGWLAAAALRRARRIAAAFPIDLRDGYVQRLLRGRSGDSLPCRVLPYSRRLDTDAIVRLTRLIERGGGQRVAMTPLPPVEQGDEDDRASLARRVAGDGSTLLILFDLSATPERETHGRLLDTLRAVDTGGRQTVLVDEASFAHRFATMPGRIAERRDAWMRMLREVGRTPVFVDLSDGKTTTAASAGVDLGLDRP